jgi:hypothetical protein
VKTHGRTAADVMTRDVITVTEDMPVGDTAHLLETKRIKRVPVLRDGRSSASSVAPISCVAWPAAATSRPPRPRRRRDDPKAASRRDRTRRLGPDLRIERGGCGRDRADLGNLESPEQGEALRVAAENVPGVKAVELNVSSIPVYAWGE